jgi:hypothetical protein
MKLKFMQFFILSLVYCSICNAQISFSPYTHFAAGQIEQGGSGNNHALGGTGIAFSSTHSLNNINPASYSGIDSLSFIFDIGVFGKYARFDKGNISQNKYSGNIRYIALGTRLCKWWAASFGITPYSSVAYKINTTSELEGEPSYYYKTFTGSGGINQFYFGNSFRLIKNLSVGVNLSYLLGEIEQKESVNVQGSTLYIVKKTNSVHNLMLEYGLQYKIDHKNWHYTIGAIYGNKKILQSATKLEMIYSGDTAKMDHDDQPFLIPQKYGVGFAVEKYNKLRAGFDYERRNWSELKFSNPQLETRNSERVSVGLEYTPMRSMRDDFWKKWYYRIGANYNKSYLIIDKEPINSKALTFGLGIPLKRQLTMLNLSFEIGQNGTTDNYLIKETYYLLHLNFALHDYWFVKPKYD